MACDSVKKVNFLYRPVIGAQWEFRQDPCLKTRTTGQSDGKKHTALAQSVNQSKPICNAPISPRKNRNRSRERRLLLGVISVRAV